MRSLLLHSPFWPVICTAGFIRCSPPPSATGRPLRITQRILDNRVSEALIAAVHGIAVLPRFSTRTDRITLRPISGIPAVRYITAVARPARAQRGAVARTLDALSAVAEGTSSVQ